MPLYISCHILPSHPPLPTDLKPLDLAVLHQPQGGVSAYMEKFLQILYSQNILSIIQHNKPPLWFNKVYLIPCSPILSLHLKIYYSCGGDELWDKREAHSVDRWNRPDGDTRHCLHNLRMQQADTHTGSAEHHRQRTAGDETCQQHAIPAEVKFI